MGAVGQRLITLEEFLQMPGNEHCELVHGEVVETMPPNKKHGRIALAIGAILRLWAEGTASGEAGVEAGFLLSRDPTTLRGPDAYYISAERIEEDESDNAFWTVAPNVAVEVVSPSETVDDVRGKIRDYLMAGAQMVWTAHISSQEIVVHTSDGLSRTYSGDDVIEYSDVLPGFSCKVSEIFS